MSLTGGYEAAFELREEVVRDIFFEAWRNGGIPHEIRADRTVAGYATHAIVQITEDGMSTRLGLHFDTPLPGGVRISVPLDLQITVDGAGAPSTSPSPAPSTSRRRCRPCRIRGETRSSYSTWRACPTDRSPS